MSELKLTQHPEITELLSVLEQNGLHKKRPSGWAAFNRNCRRPEPTYGGRAARCSEGRSQKMPSMSKIEDCLARLRPL